MQEEMTNKGCFLGLHEFNKDKNFLDTKKWATFGIRFKFIPQIVFDLLSSQDLDQYSTLIIK